jgi:hypothetical protein
MSAGNSKRLRFDNKPRLFDYMAKDLSNPKLLS